MAEPETELDRIIARIDSARKDGLITKDAAQRMRRMARGTGQDGRLDPNAALIINNRLERAQPKGKGPDTGNPDDGGESGGGQPTYQACEDVKGTAPRGMKWSGYVMVNPDGTTVDMCRLVADEDQETEREVREREARELEQRQSAEAYLSDLLTQYGLDALIPTVSGLIKEWGTNTNIIVSKLRQTDSYKERFRGNEFRIKNGYNAMSEAEYLSTEDAIRSTMRKYGLTDDYYSRDKLATLIGGDVSATEVDGRVAQAKKVIDNADPNIKNSLVGLYGVGMSDMLGYVLAPETALEVVQRRVNAGFAAGVAQGQGIDLGSMGDTSLAEQIGDLTFGDERTLRAQFDNIGGLARSTRRLSGIDQEQVTDRDVVKGEFGIDAQAGQKVKKMQSRERARFSGQSATTSATLAGGSI